MKKSYFLNLVTKLVKDVRRTHDSLMVEHIIELFENYLKVYPYDNEIRIKYILFVYLEQNDETEAISQLQKILENDPKNIIAKLMFGYVFNYSTYVNEEAFDVIFSIETSDTEYLSLKEYEKSWYYDLKDKKKCKESLIKSIEYCDSFVCNYKYLGIYYLFDEEDYKKAYYCFQRALNNVKYVFKINENYDFLSIENFIDGRLKGIIITEPLIESLHSLLNKCK